MQEYLANGMTLGWLIFPKQRQVEVFRSGSPAEVLSTPERLVAGDLMPGFELAIANLWE
jgi:Uma2 family endonuclease